MRNMYTLAIVAAVLLAAVLFLIWLCVRYIPNSQVGIVEKLWSGKGSLAEGELVALHGEAGFQPNVLRGGLHIGYWRWQYAVHKRPLITVKQGKIGYVFSRAGEALGPSQTLGRVVECNHYQDVEAFLKEGQKGRQRAILREGVYAINVAIFSVITDDGVFSTSHDRNLSEWHEQLSLIQGFDPVVIGTSSETHVDDIGIVTAHDGPSLDQGEIIAPPVGNDPSQPDYHNNFQDIEAFLRAGGRRGKQYASLLDGTYFINRWFAQVEHIPKEVVAIGEVGVVVSYYGKQGDDTSGKSFRHGERVHQGERGVWETTLGPGKYPFNTYAGKIIRVPTTNFVLHWITGKTEGHKYDESLQSIDLITQDAFEPILPLSVVVHIDYQKAPNVIQRFGDVKKLITQTIDPMLSAYFRDVAHKKTMLELVHSRDVIQQQARKELREKFEQFDIECVDVLIGKPESADKDDGKIENLLEQLRQRQLSLEQIETYGKQEAAAAKRQTLNDANAKSEMQQTLTQSSIQISIQTNEAEAQLARARKDAERRVVTAKAESESISLEGRGLSDRVSLVGQAEAEVLRKKVESFGDPRLYAISLVADAMSHSQQPLVPETMFASGGDGQIGMLGTLMTMLVAEKAGVKIPQHQGAKPASAEESVPAAEAQPPIA
jgi:uncharacterized membrane protein YqiK